MLFLGNFPIVFPIVSHCCLLNSRSFDGKTLYKWYENPTGTHEIYYILYLFYDSTKYIFIMIDDSENRKKNI